MNGSVVPVRGGEASVRWQPSPLQLQFASGQILGKLTRTNRSRRRGWVVRMQLRLPKCGDMLVRYSGNVIDRADPTR